MRVTYDPAANAVMIYLIAIPPGGVAKTYPCDPSEVDGMINLDFDAEGRLLGIEILDARQKLPSGFLDDAEILR